MAMTDQEIISQAARLRAARRGRTLKICDVCGARFEGIVQRRFCSDRCRVAAARQRRAAVQDQERLQVGDLPAPRGETESLVDHFDRIRAAIMRGGRFTEDSTALIRQSREERTTDLLEANGCESETATTNE